MSKSKMRPTSSAAAAQTSHAQKTQTQPRKQTQPNNRTQPRSGTHPKKRPTAAAPADTRSRTARFRSRHPMAAALVPIGLVVIAVATLVVIKVAGSDSPSASTLNAGGSTGGTGTSALSPTVLAALSVPSSTLDSVGSPASVTKPSHVGGAVLRGADGKPLVTYIGAEYCPFCAAERWAVAVALSRFGTFTDLSGTHSSSSDEFPNTQTLSFYGSHYVSSYVDFESVEEATNQEEGGRYGSLQTPTAAQTALMAKEDPQGDIPFIDIAGRYVIVGSSYSPQLLQGLSRTQIAADLGDPSSPVAQAIDGTANDIAAAITTVTGSQPTSVASSPAIAAIAKQLGA